MNPMAAMRLKPLMEKFQQNHPKVPLFFAAASGAIDVDSIIEITIQNPDGQSICTNMKVTPDDLELFQALGDVLPKK